MSVEHELRDALNRPLDGEQEAEERAWRVVRAATPTPGHERARRNAPARRGALMLAATAALAVALAVTPAGAEMSSWIKDGLGVESEHRPASPVIGQLPGGGELLTTTPDGAWIVRTDGSRRRVGPYPTASWSPNGLYVAGVRDRQLVAATPTGDVRWALSSASGVANPRWSPSGLRIAYLSGRSLRVVAGDGSGDAELAASAGATAPAWRPGSEDELTYEDRRGRIVTISAVTGTKLYASPPGIGPATLTWSGDGERLAVISRNRALVLSAAGWPVAERAPKPRGTLLTGAYDPTGRRLALVERHVGGSSVRIGVREVFATAASLRDIAWSPDGRWLLVSSPAADQWLFLRARRPHRVVAISGIARQIDPVRERPSFPRIAGWCRCDR